MKQVSDSTWALEVLGSDKPVIVDFWADWCGPCRKVAPVLADLETQYGGEVDFVKINVDFNPVVSNDYQIMSIPMLMVFKDGQPVQYLLGAHPKGNIEKLIKSAL